MSNLHDFRLVPEGTKSQRKGRIAPKQLAATGALAATLILGAMYAPLMWNSTSITAAAANAAPVQLHNAQSLPVDASLLKDQAALSNLYSHVSNSVVNIQVVTTGQEVGNGQLPQFPQLPSLPNDQLPSQPQQGQGSGWIYDNEGHIITNNHVVENADKVTVVFNNGFWADAEVVARDPQADLAVIKVTPPAGYDWQPLPLAADDSLLVGHSVIALGTPFGYANTMTTGIVSALDRDFPTGDFGQNRYTLPEVIQTDAAINPGNSGGPLLNLAGEVVGVNFAIESPVRGNSGVGFSIPVSIVRRVVPELIKNGKFTYPYLGLSGRTIDQEVAHQLKLDNTQLGVYVASVVDGGPAAKAGIKGAEADNAPLDTQALPTLPSGGDIVTAINGEKVRHFEDMVAYLVTKASPGQTVKLSILRGGKPMEIEVVLGERPGASQQNNRQAEKGGVVSARQAFGIASDAVKDSLSGPITDRTVSPDTRDGKDVWVVELSDGSQTATVVVDRTTGDVLEMSVK